MNSNLFHLNPAELEQFHSLIKERYQRFCDSGWNIDMTRGKPSPEQLALSNELLSLPGDNAFYSQEGIDCRNYGVLGGLEEAKLLFGEILNTDQEHVVVADNSSLALMHDIILFAWLKGMEDLQPWVKEEQVSFLCPVPGYDRHFAICQEFGIKMIPISLNNDGPDMEVVERLVASDPKIKGMWCVPQYSNPTGIVYSDSVIKRLATMKAAAPDFRLFWDNAYAVHHLTDEQTEIADIIYLCEQSSYTNRPFVFGSTSKITFAGSGLAAVASSKSNLRWFLNQIKYRTIGPDKLNQLRHVQFLQNKAGILALMKRHRQILAPKFQKTNEVFTQMLEGTGVATWTKPKGGYFISVDVLEGCATKCVKLAKEAGITLTTAGATYPYGVDPKDQNIRIAPSYPDLSEISVAAEGIALSILLAVASTLQFKSHGYT